jgi:N-acetylneuraminate synthase/N,N'-diacetyllegionaminate synthase
MIIGNHDTTCRPLLIAELGNNHEGDPQFAFELADAAVEAGADAVKVQVIDPLRLVTASQSERIAQLTRFRLGQDVFREIARRVHRRGRLFFASVFDCDTLSEMGDELDAVKIASGDLNFDPLLRTAAMVGRPVVLSTGMARMDEIVRAVGVIADALPPSHALAQHLAVLHCVSLYPTSLEQANLRAIPTIAARLGLTVGYSDHTLGTEAALVAVALGARIIEKHFTLDKARSSFRDHALSAEPEELARLARAIHAFDAMLGSGARDEAVEDSAARTAARRSIVAARPLDRGATLEADDLDYVRPAAGLPPPDAGRLLGRRLRRPLARHELILQSDVE